MNFSAQYIFYIFKLAVQPEPKLHHANASKDGNRQFVYSDGEQDAELPKVYQIDKAH